MTAKFPMHLWVQIWVQVTPSVILRLFGKSETAKPLVWSLRYVRHQRSTEDGVPHRSSRFTDSQGTWCKTLLRGDILIWVHMVHSLIPFGRFWPSTPPLEKAYTNVIDRSGLWLRISWIAHLRVGGSFSILTAYSKYIHSALDTSSPRVGAFRRFYDFPSFDSLFVNPIIINSIRIYVWILRYLRYSFEQ